MWIVTWHAVPLLVCVQVTAERCLIWNHEATRETPGIHRSTPPSLRRTLSVCGGSWGLCITLFLSFLSLQRQLPPPTASVHNRSSRWVWRPWMTVRNKQRLLRKGASLGSCSMTAARVNFSIAPLPCLPLLLLAHVPKDRFREGRCDGVNRLFGCLVAPHLRDSPQSKITESVVC